MNVPLALLLLVVLASLAVMPATVKAGVILEGVDLERMAPVVGAVERVWSSYGVGAVITSGLRDSDTDSRHALGLALDFRVKNLPRNVWSDAGRAVAAQLSPALYDVVLEVDRSSAIDSPANRSHLHIEFDPTPAKLTRASGFSEVFI